MHSPYWFSAAGNLSGSPALSPADGVPSEENPSAIAFPESDAGARRFAQPRAARPPQHPCRACSGSGVGRDSASSPCLQDRQFPAIPCSSRDSVASVPFAKALHDHQPGVTGRMKMQRSDNRQNPASEGESSQAGFCRPSEDRCQATPRTSPEG